ncbi:phosphatidate cytidylyltransferase [Solimonas aquatica]|uniref:Phosphatidate cytidylyltransferase n=1 Tax=Solimonas aquatica TaxID=489703 RepID=A0A1H9AKZ1_9GAMM|nr:phosphatidate cytidylyltransferase [Solimonas aquatica]SEP77043.1 phosphatidate cytidylyltransferase [Solimonas aquatica]
MLKQRVITALVLLPILLALVFYAPTAQLYAALGLAGLAMAWEWTGLLRWQSAAARWAYVLLAALLLAAAWHSPLKDRALDWLLLPVVGAWLLMPLRFRGFPQRAPLPGALAALAGQVMIVSTLLSIAALHALPQGSLKLLFVLFLVFAADTGAYFAGRALGRHKLAPSISPGKTVEGALGGLALCALWAATAGAHVFGLHGARILVLVALSLLVAVLSIVGDLTESMLKRAAGLKDSGKILPGHGGVLDRVDSIVAALPTMVLGLHLLQLQ